MRLNQEDFVELLRTKYLIAKKDLSTGKIIAADAALSEKTMEDIYDVLTRNGILLMISDRSND